MFPDLNRNLDESRPINFDELSYRFKRGCDTKIMGSPFNTDRRGKDLTQTIHLAFRPDQSNSIGMHEGAFHIVTGRRISLYAGDNSYRSLCDGFQDQTNPLWRDMDNLHSAGNVDLIDLQRHKVLSFFQR